MRSKFQLLLFASVCLGLFACERKKEPEDEVRADRVFKGKTERRSAKEVPDDDSFPVPKTAKPSSAAKLMDDFADAVCACKDVECVTKLAQKFADEALKMPIDSDPIDQKATEAATERMTKCVMKLAMK